MKINYEDAYKELEEILMKLETSTNNLDESLELYKKGIELYKHCNNLLEEAKLTIVKYGEMGIEEKLNLGDE